jgi:hypothetical protein
MEVRTYCCAKKSRKTNAMIVTKLQRSRIDFQMEVSHLQPAVSLTRRYSLLCMHSYLKEVAGIRLDEFFASTEGYFFKDLDARQCRARQPGRRRCKTHLLWPCLPCRRLATQSANNSGAPFLSTRTRLLYVLLYALYVLLDFFPAS